MKFDNYSIDNEQKMILSSKNELSYICSLNQFRDLNT